TSSRLALPIDHVSLESAWAMYASPCETITGGRSEARVGRRQASSSAQAPNLKRRSKEKSVVERRDCTGSTRRYIDITGSTADDLGVTIYIMDRYNRAVWLTLLMLFCLPFAASASEQGQPLGAATYGWDLALTGGFVMSG